jgi:glyoxylase-like metal-dependent hydrolase (beta-lactamase superfamily II)
VSATTTTATTTAPAPIRFDDGSLLLDTSHGGRHGTIGVYLVPQRGAAGRAGRFDLVEVGAAVDVARIEAAIGALGLDPGAVERVLVTHIHLDHAGAAGAWARRHGARVVVTREGARHLTDPSRLMASAARVYGDALERLWGRMTPVPEGAIEAVDDGDELRVGGRRVRVLSTPGHARHHASFVFDDVIYAGDAAGVRFAPWPLVRPAVPPPEIDLVAWDASFARLRRVAASQLRLTHFGAFDDVEHHLAEAQTRTHAWADAALAWADAGLSRDEAIRACDDMARADLEAVGADGATIRRYLATSDAAMSVDGLARYWRVHHAERWPGWRETDG